ncbi:sperm microtubule associated protein 2-like [Ambystoma mexicanum]|uniref:sperm microtubule associated protein 2-like n=1 Tax=Ambystoma mexicanum TaxID=8296 RepID=UPI0037E7F22C
MAEAVPLDHLSKPEGLGMEKQMNHNENRENAAGGEKMSYPTVNHQKSTGQKENMETGDYSQNREQQTRMEGTPKDHPMQQGGDSLVASDFSGDVPGVQARPLEKLPKPKSISHQENLENSGDQRKDLSGGSEDSQVEQPMQHSGETLLETTDFSDDLEEVARRPSPKVSKHFTVHKEHEDYEYHRQRRDDHSPGDPSRRILELAIPKRDKRIWATRYSKVVWGNQDPIWPRSFSALSVPQSERILSLAKPKKNFQPESQRPFFPHELRQSSSLLERVPFLDLPSDRILRLAEPKKRSETSLDQRSQSATLTYKASKRILQLSIPRPLHSDYLADRQIPVRSKSSMAPISPRIEHCLSNPKLKMASPCFPPERPEALIRPVSKMARCAVASPRTVQLAKPRDFPTECQPGRSEIWYLSRGAARAIATSRTVELSQPIKRFPMNTVQYNPDAFVVKEAAKKAVCSSRIATLAQPISR